MKPNTKITITNLKTDIDTDTIEAIPGLSGVVKGMKGVLVTGKQDDPQHNPGYYEVRLNNTLGTFCLHCDEFSVDS